MKWLILFWVGVFSMKASAQSSGSSLLWEISGNGLTKPSYLYGTFHMLCANDYTISEVIKQKLLGTRKLYLEVDITKPGIQQELMTQMKFTETSLDKELGADFQQVDQAFQKITGISFIPNMPYKLVIRVPPNEIKNAATNWKTTFLEAGKSNKSSKNPVKNKINEAAIKYLIV